MNKNELLEKFKVLGRGSVDTNNNCIGTRNSYYCTDCLYCHNCHNCYDCYYCHNCYGCYYCYDCYNCILCKDLTDKTSGYWLLNKEVTREEFEAAKKAMGY